jgi:UDPglucose 6-dehydrogenase
MAQAKRMMPSTLIFGADANETVTGADAVVVVTEWNEFRAIAPTRLRGLMRGDVVVDLRNVFDPAAMINAGFRYSAIGRPNHLRD